MRWSDAEICVYIVGCSESMKRVKLAGEQSSFDTYPFRAKDNDRFENQLRVFTIKFAGGCYKVYE